MLTFNQLVYGDANPQLGGQPQAHANTLWLIDASIFVFRAWHSVPNTLVDAAGQPTNALHGFARFLSDVLEQVRPQHMAVAFDESLRNSFRNRLYPAYKANRDPAPEELRRQFAWCKQLCDVLGIARFGSPDFEADDIIGTLATQARAQGKRVVILSRDKDLSQLIRPGDVYWDYLNDKRYEYDDIAPKFGVVPERMACYLALMGDAVDNIQGVPGVGAKTAATLFRHFESIHHLYDDLPRVLKLKLRSPGFVVGQLQQYREAAMLARQLTEIFCTMPLVLDNAALQRRRPDMSAVRAFYESVNFGPLLPGQAARIVEQGLWAELT